MNILTILTWLINHKKVAVKAICAASVAFFLLWGINTHKQNIKLSQELEMAQNNIEAYLELLDSSLLATNVLRLDIEDLKDLNDVYLQRIDSMRKQLKIKPKLVEIAATQSLYIDVIESKGVRGNIIDSIKHDIYRDTIKYNDLTSVYYTIGEDTVTIALDIKNDQYLYIYHKKQYKNKKNFLKRIFTLDFKKIKKTKYHIVNTNSAIKTENIRIVENNE